MRFVKCWVVVVGLSSAVASSGGAQNGASSPAGVTRHRESSGALAPLDSGRTSLRTHMVRGGMIGAFTGLALGGLAVAWASHSGGQCVFVTSFPGLDENGCSNLTGAKAAKIVVGGLLIGAGTGLLLGAEYHATKEEERAARCRAHPDTTCS